MCIRRSAITVMIYFVRYSPLFLIGSVALFGISGFLIHLLEPSICLQRAYEYSINFFFAIESPFIIPKSSIIVIGILNLLAGWLMIPAIIGIIVSEVQESMIEKRIAYRNLELKLIEELGEEQGKKAFEAILEEIERMKTQYA